jgi:hypothetical protein
MSSGRIPSVLLKARAQRAVAQSCSKFPTSTSWAVVCCRSSSSAFASEVRVDGGDLVQLRDGEELRRERFLPFVISRSRVQLPPPAPTSSRELQQLSGRNFRGVLPNRFLRSALLFYGDMATTRRRSSCARRYIEATRGHDSSWDPPWLRRLLQELGEEGGITGGERLVRPI